MIATTPRNPSKLTKGVAEYSVAGTDAGVGALYTALAAGAGGPEGDPEGAVLVGGLFGGIALWEGTSGTVDVVESGCFLSGGSSAAPFEICSCPHLEAPAYSGMEDVTLGRAVKAIGIRGEALAEAIVERQ